MEVSVPMMIQDPLVWEDKVKRLQEEANARRQEDTEKPPPTENFILTSEEFFLDGPVTKRVAVLDFDPRTGELVPGARFMPPDKRRVRGRYDLPKDGGEYDLASPHFQQVSVFATVLRTMYMFEEPDALGRPLTWAFDGTQLLVVPRAGEWANAYYERESHSLQFFFFADTQDPNRTIYTSLSRDIIAHETAHAILDGIAPDLYHSITPQSLALHEAIADLTALLLAFRSRTLRPAVLKHTNGSIANSTAFSSVAEEFGRARDPSGRVRELRSLLNQKTLDPNDASRDELGRPNLVTRHEPHELSQVLSGALYTVMVKLHEDHQDKLLAERPNQTRFSLSGLALANSGNQFKRMIFRALDYLPPGEITFADYGRAIIAADQAAHPSESEGRDWIVEEFVRRHMAPNREALAVRQPFEYVPLREIDLETLVESDWAAYQFADRNREFLGIPAEIPFHVRPRLDTTKLFYFRDGPQEIREIIFKVAWQHSEPNTERLQLRFPLRRQITVGTTLVVDAQSKQVRALLTTTPAIRSTETLAEEQADRDAMLRQLSDSGLLQIDQGPLRSGSDLFGTGVTADIMDGLMRIQGAARMLHIAGEV